MYSRGSLSGAAARTGKETLKKQKIIVKIKRKRFVIKKQQTAR